MNQQERQAIGEELFIEELGEIRGGLTLSPGWRLTLARGLGEEGTQPWPPAPPKKPVPGKPPVVTTLALGEEGTSVPYIVPASGE